MCWCNPLKEVSHDGWVWQACTSPSTKLWLVYMDMVMTLKRHTHAERGAYGRNTWLMLTMWLWLVAADPCKYVSCLPHGLESMRDGPTLALNIMKVFKDGQFTVCQTEGRVNGVWTDMALQTNNSDAKTKLFTSISQQSAAMHGEIIASSPRSDRRIRVDKRQWHTWIWMTPQGYHQASHQVIQEVVPPTTRKWLSIYSNVKNRRRGTSRQARGWICRNRQWENWPP